MNIGAFIFLTLLMLLACIVIFFIFKDYFRIKNNNLNIRNIVILSIILGIFLMLNEIYVRQFIESISISVSISAVTISIFIIYLNRYFLIIPFAMTIGGYFIYNGNIENVNEIIPLINLTILSAGSFLYSFIRILDNKSIYLKFSINLLIIILSSSFATLFNLQISIDTMFFMSLYYVLYQSLIFIPLTFFIWIIERLYIRHEKIETFTNFDYISYYKMSLAQEHLIRKIKKDGITFGALFFFDIATSNTYKLERILINLKKNLSDQYKDPFFFKATPFYYAVFIPIKKEVFNFEDMNEIKIDKLSEKNYFSNFKNTLKKIQLEEELNYLKGYGSIYGINSTDINELISQSLFLINKLSINKEKNNKSILTIFDYEKVVSFSTNKLIIQSISKYIENYKIYFIRSLYDENVFYPTLKFNDKKINLDFLKNELSQKEYLTLIRYFSLKFITEFNKNYNYKNSRLIIPFTISNLLIDDFKIENFIKKISNYIKPQKIILGLEEEKNYSSAISIINKFKKRGIEIAILKAEIVSINFIKDIKPNYYLQSPKEFFSNLFFVNKPLKNKKILSNLKEL